MDTIKELNNKVDALVQAVNKQINGGKGSGNFGHEGRPGEIGGSAPAEYDSAEAELENMEDLKKKLVSLETKTKLLDQKLAFSIPYDKKDVEKEKKLSSRAYTTGKKFARLAYKYGQDSEELKNITKQRIEKKLGVKIKEIIPRDSGWECFAFDIGKPDLKYKGKKYHEAEIVVDYMNWESDGDHPENISAYRASIVGDNGWDGKGLFSITLKPGGKWEVEDY